MQEHLVGKNSSWSNS